VDDEKGIRLLLSEALEGKGFEVTQARDGQECLDQLAGNSFDLVVTDIRMPKLNGIEVMKWMKKAGRKEKIIVITGSPSDLCLSEKEMPPIVTQLHKPFMVDSFLEMVFFAMSGANSMSGAGSLLPRRGTEMTRQVLQ
jgi:two-component system response regulator PilR (NtrC family)